jgi:starch phosphorylase
MSSRRAYHPATLVHPQRNGADSMLEALRNSPHVAYFSMEIALASSIPTYSGGLGVLAGDMMRSAADLALQF